MKKSFTPYTILVILFALFHVFTFAIPSNKTPTFWVAYGFTVAMFFVEAIILFMTFSKSHTPQKQFLSWPLICVGTAYFVVQTLLFFPFKLFPSIPPWIAVVVHSLVFGLALICMVATKASTKLISRFDEAHKR